MKNKKQPMSDEDGAVIGEATVEMTRTSHIDVGALMDIVHDRTNGRWGEKLAPKEGKATAYQNPIILAAPRDILADMLVRRLSQRFGSSNIDFVYNGRELVDSVQNRNYGLVMVNDTMPEMDGVAMVKSIRQFNQEVPILMMYAYGRSQHALEADVTDSILKPFDGIEFMDKVERLYQGEPRRRENG